MYKNTSRRLALLLHLHTHTLLPILPRIDPSSPITTGKQKAMQCPRQAPGPGREHPVYFVYGHTAGTSTRHEKERDRARRAAPPRLPLHNLAITNRRAKCSSRARRPHNPQPPSGEARDYLVGERTIRMRGLKGVGSLGAPP